MRRMLYVLAFLFLAAPALAQTPVVGTEQLQWDQAAPTLPDAQALNYSPLIDVTTPPATLVPFAGVTCGGATSPFVCAVRLPALTTGLHQIRIIASKVVGAQTLASAPSLPLSLLIMAIPAVPQNLRIG